MEAQTCERDQPGLRGLGLRDPVKQDVNGLGFKFTGGLLYGLSLLCLLCCLPAPCPALLPFSQASYVLRICAPLGCKLHKVRAHILLLSRNPVMRFLGRVDAQSVEFDAQPLSGVWSKLRKCVFMCIYLVKASSSLFVP